MKIRKTVALFLSAALALGMTACGTEQPAATAKEDKPVAAATGKNAEGTAHAIDDNLYGYVEPVTIQIGITKGKDLVYHGSEDAEHNTWMDLYRENNIIPEIMYEVDASQASAKLTNAIISGEYPDMICCSVSEYADFVESGVIADITDLVDQYGTDQLEEYLNADGGQAVDFITIDGRLYGLPNVGNGGYDAVPLMHIRQDWLDNLGLEIPTTMEELHEVAYAFSHNDPDKNGKDDTYGLALNGVDVLLPSIGDLSGFFSAFDAHVGAEAMNFIEEDGKITWGGTKTENMKAALTLLREMYEDGSIASDFITMDVNKLFEETGAGRCGIWFAPMWGSMGAIGNALNTSATAHMVVAPIPAGMGQENAAQLFESKPDKINCISSQCEHPEVLIKLMNLSVQKLCYPENEEEFLTYYGDPQRFTGYKCTLTNTLMPFKNLRNYYKDIEAVATGNLEGLSTEQKGDSEKMIQYKNAFESDGISPEELENPDIIAGAGLYTVFGDPQCAFTAIDQMLKNNQFVYNAYNYQMTENMTDNSATLKKLTAETIVKIITGSEDVDYYDTFLKNWLALGGQDCIDDAQAWFDAQ